MRGHAAIFWVLPAMLAGARAHAVESDCIVVSNVGVVDGVETTGTRRLCRSAGSARYDIVESAVYNASLTEAAFEKASDPQLRAMRAEVGRLQAQVEASSGESTAAAEALARAQKTFVAELAKRDRAFAEAIAQFRGTVADIAATPEGAAALAEYNAGNEAGAIAILDRINAVNDAARKRRDDIASAVEKRRIANLALDARAKGKVSLVSVIVRFEQITKLDPGVYWDWIKLGRLYQDAGRLDSAKNAFNAARRNAKELEWLAATTDLSIVLMRQGNLSGADAVLGESLAIARQLALDDPVDSKVQQGMSVVLQRIGDVRLQQGDLTGANAAFSESLAITRRRFAADEGKVEAQQNLFFGLNRLGYVRLQQGDPLGADELIGESLVLARRMSRDDPGDARAQRNIFFAQFHVGSIRLQQGDLIGAGAAYGESLAIARQLAAADPANAEAQRDLVLALLRTGVVRLRQGDLSGADAALSEGLAKARRLADSDPSNAQTKADVSHILESLNTLRRQQAELAAGSGL